MFEIKHRYKNPIACLSSYKVLEYLINQNQYSVSQGYIEDMEKELETLKQCLMNLVNLLEKKEHIIAQDLLEICPTYGVTEVTKLSDWS